MTTGVDIAKRIIEGNPVNQGSIIVGVNKMGAYMARTPSMLGSGVGYYGPEPTQLEDKYTARLERTASVIVYTDTYTQIFGSGSNVVSTSGTFDILTASETITSPWGTFDNVAINDIAGTGVTTLATVNATTGSFTTLSSTTTQPSVINFNYTQHIASGDVSGSGICGQPFQGDVYKKVIIYSNELSGVITYTFPTAFVRTPVTMGDSNITSKVTSLDTTAVEITNDGTNGFLILEGY